MARYLLATGIDRFFGSRQGSTFQKCGKVFSIRKRNVPVQKKSARQSVFKNAFAANASRWKDLTGTQQTTWTTFSPDFSRVDSLGNSFNLEPQALQISSNVRRLTTGQPQLNSLSAAIAVVPFIEDTFILGVGSQVFDIVITPPIVQAACRLVVFGGQPNAIKLSFTKSDTRFVRRLFTGTNTTTLNFWNTYTAAWPGVNLTIGHWIPLLLEVVQGNTGQVIGTLQSWAEIEP